MPHEIAILKTSHVPSESQKGTLRIKIQKINLKRIGENDEQNTRAHTGK